jgi:hypothetical protein
MGVSRGGLNQACSTDKVCNGGLQCDIINDKCLIPTGRPCNTNETCISNNCQLQTNNEKLCMNSQPQRTATVNNFSNVNIKFNKVEHTKI